jgi:DNA-directed RNA polymerase sigma subunit (sigma70/sigma32)
MRTFLWPAEDGWPYPDTEGELADLAADVDDDLLSVRAPGSHLFDDLDPVERQVIAGRYGLDGHAPRSMRELHNQLGLTRAELRSALGSGLGKLRAHLTG